MSNSGVISQGASKRSAATKAILTIVGIALFFGFVTLGTWQVQRRAWKLDLMERVETRLHQAPLSIAQLGSATPPDQIGEQYAYQPVFAQGQWLADKTIFSQALTEIGSGFWVITPLQMADGSSVLVNRGFVPEGQRSAVQSAPQGDVRIEGLLRASETGRGFLRENDPANNKWYARDVKAISAALGLANAKPFFIDQGIPANVHVNADTPLPASATQGPWPRSGMTVVKFHNSHAVYIATWYSLALMVLIAAWLVVRHERKKAQSPDSASDA